MDQQQRVWFLDEARGLSVLLMVLHHGAYDAVFLLGWPLPFLFSGWFGVIRAFFAGVFVLISGCACRLSRNNLRRGARCLLLAAGSVFGHCLVDPLPANPLWRSASAGLRHAAFCLPATAIGPDSPFLRLRRRVFSLFLLLSCP